MNEFETTQQSRYQALLAAHETTAAVLVGIPGKPCALEESGPTCPWPTFVEDVILELARRAENLDNPCVSCRCTWVGPGNRILVVSVRRDLSVRFYDILEADYESLDADIRAALETAGWNIGNVAPEAVADCLLSL